MNITASASSCGVGASAVAAMYIFPVGLKVGDHGGTHITGRYSGMDAIVTGFSQSPNDPGILFTVLNWPDYAIGKTISVACSGTYNYSYSASPVKNSNSDLDGYGLVDLEGKAPRTQNLMNVTDPDLKMCWAVIDKIPFFENCTLSWREKEYSFRIIYQP